MVETRTARRWVSALIGAALAAAALAAPMLATTGEETTSRVLVLRTGERLELKAPWRLDGKRVLYLTESGTLTAIRASEVDLPASARATANPPAAASAAPAAPREAVLVLDASNTKVVAKAGEGASSTGGGAAAPPGAAQQPPPETLLVESYTSVPGEGSITIYGTVRNRGGSHATRISVLVRLLDEAGDQIAEAPGHLVRSDVAAGATTNFQAFFPDVLVYGAVEFDLQEKAR